jgi:inhibitor of growth protein 3
MPRDDLSINGSFKMAPGEHLDPLTVLEDFTSRVSNLPAELRFMQDEIAEKDRQLQMCLEAITMRDAAIQKWIKANGALAPNPKEEQLAKVVQENYDRAQILQEEKVALAEKSLQALDRHLKSLDLQIKGLQDRGEFPDDNDMPSLLRPQTNDRPRTTNAAAVAANGGAAGAAVAGANRQAQQAYAQRLAGQQVGGPQTGSLPHSAPGTPAAALLLQRQQRESSAGASNKRQRLSGVGSVPAASSGLARHASVGPGTPKAGTPSSTRAGSADPRGSQKSGATGKKVAPHKQSAAQKSKPGKSGLSRVKKVGTNRASPTTTNDSELSDPDTGSAVDDDDEPAKMKDTDTKMEDADEGDNQKYCICQKVSFGDMVACDNEECPFEWFHWPCVGLKSEPEGTWICPVCTEKMKKK